MRLIKEEDTAPDPMGYFEYAKMEFPYWGNPRGRNKAADYETTKFNRYVKIGIMADELINQFKEQIESNVKSTNGRCALACMIMMQHGIRVGNEGSAEGYASGLKDNKGELVHTYGVTTLLNKHVEFSGDAMTLDFLGKEQVHQNIVVGNPFIVRYSRVLYDPMRPNDKWLNINYDTLFKYVRSNVGDGFVPKDFRTFCANVTCWLAMDKYLDKPPAENKTAANKEVKDIVEVVANRLGNTPSVSKSNYIDSRSLDWFKEQRLDEDG